MDTKEPRPKFNERKFLLSGEEVLVRAQALLGNVPIDPMRPLEVVIREAQKPRRLDQNSLMWVGPLKDIAEQGYIEGRRLHIKAWHEIFKEAYLPEEFDPELTKEGYQKWAFDRRGNRVLIGGTTELTVKGFALYLEQIYADGANLGVVFTENPKNKIPGWVK